MNTNNFTYSPSLSSCYKQEWARPCNPITNDGQGIHSNFEDKKFNTVRGNIIYHNIDYQNRG